MYSRYNLGQVAVGIGDLGLAYQCFKIATSVDPNHSESYNNLGVYFLSPLPLLLSRPSPLPLLTHLQVLDMRKSNLEQARSNFRTASNLGPQLHEPLYNSCNFPSPSPSLSSSSLPPLPSSPSPSPYLLSLFLAILMYKMGDFQESYKQASSALKVFPEHEESKDIINLLRNLFTEK